MSAPGALIAWPAASFVDVSLRNGDGFEVLAWIRQRRAFDSLPVIMFAATDDPRQTEESRRLGAQCHLVKYPSKSVFAEVLEAAGQFSAVRGASVFDLPGNLLRLRDERR